MHDICRASKQYRPNSMHHDDRALIALFHLGLYCLQQEHLSMKSFLLTTFNFLPLFSLKKNNTSNQYLKWEEPNKFIWQDKGYGITI